MLGKGLPVRERDQRDPIEAMERNTPLPVFDQLIRILIHNSKKLWPCFARLSNIWPQFLPPDLSRDNRVVQVWWSGAQSALEPADLARI